MLNNMRNIFLYILILIFPLSFFSCKNKKNNDNQKSNENKTQKTVKIEDFNYVDTNSGELTVMLIGKNGEAELTTTKPDKIFQKTESGLNYRRIVSHRSNKYPIPGDIVTIDFTYSTEDGKILFDSKKISNNFVMTLKRASHSGGCFEEALGMLAENDSAVYKIDAYNFYHYTQGKELPAPLKKGDKLIFNIKMLKIETQTDFIKENKEIYSYYNDVEKSDIQKYLSILNKPYKKTTNGLYIVTVEKGSSRQVKNGDLITIDYSASFIDGTVFNSTFERNKPFRFVVGKKEVIEGLDQAVTQMKVGEHSIIIIPFRLAYGDQKYQSIPPFSTLIFEVKILNAE